MPEKELGAFWEREGKEGLQYFTGEISGKRCIMFHNKYKQKGDKQPTFRVYAAKENPNYKKDSRTTDWHGPEVLSKGEMPIAFNKEDEIAISQIPF